jgi:predicted phage tail protein
MQVIYFNGQAVERFNVQVVNLVQLYDYLRVNMPEVFKDVTEKELCYTVYIGDKEKAYPILPSMLAFDISSYDVLVICPKITGDALFSTIAVGTMAAIAGTTTAAVSAAAAAGTLVATVGLGTAIAGYAVAAVVTVGLIIGLGMLVRALTPQNKLDNNQDPSNLSKLYNGVPNITEQGGSVPVVFGNCLFGGVRIGLRLEQALSVYPDVIPIATFPEGMNYPSNWMRFV